jgi:membrane protein required for colicin V production
MVIVFTVLALVGKMLEATIRLVMLGWVNRLLGVCFSLLKCILILGLVILAFNALNNTFGFVKPEQLADSTLYPIIKNLADSIFPYLKSFFTLQ